MIADTKTKKEKKKLDPESPNERRKKPQKGTKPKAKGGRGKNFNEGEKGRMVAVAGVVLGETRFINTPISHQRKYFLYIADTRSQASLPPGAVTAGWLISLYNDVTSCCA